MKKTLFLLMLFTVSLCYAQLPPAEFRDGIKVPFIQVDKKTTAEKLAMDVSDTSVTHYVFDTDLGKLQENSGLGWVSIGGEIDLGADYIWTGLHTFQSTSPYITIYDTDDFRSANYKPDGILFSRDGFNLDVTTGTLTGNYNLNIPSITQNDTLALRSDLTPYDLQSVVDSGGTVTSPDGTSFFMGVNNTDGDGNWFVGTNLVGGVELTNNIGVTQDRVSMDAQDGLGGGGSVYIRHSNGVTITNYANSNSTTLVFEDGLLDAVIAIPAPSAAQDTLALRSEVASATTLQGVLSNGYFAEETHGDDQGEIKLFLGSDSESGDAELWYYDNVNDGRIALDKLSASVYTAIQGAASISGGLLSNQGEVSLYKDYSATGINNRNELVFADPTTTDLSATKVIVPVPKIAQDTLAFKSALGLESIDEGNGAGFRIGGRDPSEFGDIGKNAVDFGTNISGPSTTIGATGESSFNIGEDNIVSGYGSTSLGFLNTISGDASYGFGQHLDLILPYSGAIGYNVNITGDAGTYFANFATGKDNNLVNAFSSSLYGSALIKTGGVGVTVFGTANEDIASGNSFLDSEPLTIWGNGTHSLAGGNVNWNNTAVRSNAAVLYRNGIFEFPTTTVTDILSDGRKDIAATVGVVEELVSELNLEDKAGFDTYTFSIEDRNKIVTFDSALDGTYVIPLNSNVNFEIGDMITIDSSLGQGMLTIEGEAGVTFETIGTGTNNEVVNIKKVAEDEWRTLGLTQNNIYLEAIEPTVVGTEVFYGTPFVSSVKNKLIRWYEDGQWWYEWKQMESDNNLYILSNAASPNNEADSAVGVGNSDPDFVGSSTSSDFYTGSYSLQWVRAGADNQTAAGEINLVLESGATYEVTVWIKRISGGNFSVGLNDAGGWVADDLVTIGTSAPTEWTKYVFTGTTAQTNVDFDVNANSNSDAGNTILIDNLIIHKISN